MATSKWVDVPAGRMFRVSGSALSELPTDGDGDSPYPRKHWKRQQVHFPLRITRSSTLETTPHYPHNTLGVQVVCVLALLLHNTRFLA